MLGTTITPPSLRALLARLHGPKPPALGVLIRRLEGSESSRQFEGIVRTLLPNQADAILARPELMEQLTAFFEAFNREYFPLYEDMLDFHTETAESEADVLDSICRYGMPIPKEGIEGSYLHELHDDWKPAPLLMACLGDISSRFYGDDHEGVRVTWLESLGNHVGRELLQRIPEGGWPLKRLQVLLHDTEYEGAIFTVEWATGNTGCQFLDTNREDGWENPPWTVNNAYQGKLEWRAYQAISDEMTRMERWLEQDLNRHFGELLTFIERRDAEVPQDQEHAGCFRLREIFGEQERPPTSETAVDGDAADWDEALDQEEEDD